MATTGHQRRSAIASTTNAPARASSDERDEREEEPGRADRDEHGGQRPATAVLPGDAGEEQRDDEGERGRERADEARDEPPEQPVLGVERPVVREAARTVVVEAELVAEVADRAGAAPPLDVDRIEVDQPADGQRCTGAEQRPADPAELDAVEDQRAAEEVRDDRDKPVAKAVEDRPRAGFPVEHVLRDEGVEADDGCEGEGEPVDDPRAERKPSLADRVQGHARNGHGEQGFLPGLHGVDRSAAQPGVVEQREHEVVQRQPDDEDVEGDDRAPPDGDRRHGEQHAVERRGRAESRDAFQPQEHLAGVAIRRLGALVAGGRAQAGGGEPVWSSASVSRVPR